MSELKRGKKMPAEVCPKPWRPNSQAEAAAVMARVARRRRAASFTLVELLIVVGVIAILAALLLPALQSARDQAHSATCKSNLKQVAQWGYSYADDWGEVLPTCGNRGDDFRHLSLTVWYKKYPDFKGDVYPGLMKLFQCPQTRKSLNPRYKNAWFDSDYALNEFLGGMLYPSYVQNYGQPTTPRLTNLTSEVFWFADGNLWYAAGYDFAVLYYTSYTGSYGPWMWDDRCSGHWFGMGHPGNTANYIFGDGHTDTLAYRDFLIKRSKRAFLGLKE